MLVRFVAVRDYFRTSLVLSAVFDIAETILLHLSSDFLEASCYNFCTQKCTCLQWLASNICYA